ncbi:MAG: DUF3127 domain-containing protein [Muribaculaceae bacterium]|nr:DUF3127 domain-containing protein [Muribaculaceae bacterium]
MEIHGKIIVALPEQSGTSKSGNAWKKREYVLETMDTYPRKVHFHFFGDRADQYPLSVGEEVTISFDINSREFNGRWYTDISAWKAERGSATQQAGPVPPVVNDTMPGGYGLGSVPATSPLEAAPGGEDDLPF